MTTNELTAALGILAAAILGALHVRNVKVAAWVAAMVPRLAVEALAAVREVSQTYTDAILAGRDPASPGGASLTEAEKAEARRRAIATLRANFGQKGWDRLMRILGIADEEAYAVTHVEAAVNKVKADAKAADAGDKLVFALRESQKMAPVAPRSIP